MQIRFFSERVFGAWVDGTIVRKSKKKVVIEAYFQGNSWEETKSIDTEFYWPSGHPQQGEAFRLTRA